MGLEEVNGPKEVQREREVTNPWVVCDVESEKGPQQAWSNASKESKGVNGKPMSPKDEGYGNWAREA